MYWWGYLLSSLVEEVVAASRNGTTPPHPHVLSSAKKNTDHRYKNTSLIGQEIFLNIIWANQRYPRQFDGHKGGKIGTLTKSTYFTLLAKV